VAGQRVLAESATLGTAALRRGAWVDVSGLRTPDGDIAATRIDPRPSGPVTVHGSVVEHGGAVYVGSLRLRPGAATPPAAGQFARVTGRYAGGALLVDSATPDAVVTDPAAYFGSAIQRLVIEGYAQGSAGRVTIGPSGLSFPAPGFAPVDRGRSIVTLERGPDGGLRAVTFNPSPPATSPRPGSTSAPSGMRFSPAPVPSARSFGSGGAAFPGGVNGRRGPLARQPSGPGAGPSENCPGPSCAGGARSGGPGPPQH
jgi:hypothetical protein